MFTPCTKRLVGLAATIHLGCSKPAPAPIDPAPVAPQADVSKHDNAAAGMASEDGGPAVAPDVAAGGPAVAADVSAPTAGAAPDAVTPPDAAAPEPAVEARERAVTLLVPRGDDYTPIGCWIVPAPDASLHQEEMPRWAEREACLPFVAVDAPVFGGKTGVGTVTAVDGERVRTSASGAFLVVAPAGDRRLASIFPARRGVLEPLAAPAADTPTSALPAPPADATAADPAGVSDSIPAPSEATGATAPSASDATQPPSDAAPADADADATPADAGPGGAPADPDAGKARRTPATDAQREAVTRAIKRLNGTDYPRADISVGDAIWADIDGDEKLDAILLGSSIELSGEGHSSGGGAFYADGRNPARLYEMAVEGQLTDVDVIALSDLDDDGRLEVLLKMECPTGTGFYLAQWNPLGLGGVDHLGAVEEDGVMCAGFGSAKPPTLPPRTFAHAAVSARGLAAFTAPFGIALGAPVEAVMRRLGLPHDLEAPSTLLLSSRLSLAVEAGEVRALSVSSDGARFLADRLGDAVGLDRLLDYDPKELATALRPYLGKQRVTLTESVAFDGPVQGGKSVFLAFDCNPASGCYQARVALYTPKKGLGVRSVFLGLTSRSTPEDVAGIFGPPEVSTTAAPGPMRYVGGKVEATFEKDALRTLTIDREGLAAVKKPGFFSVLGEPLTKLTSRFGAPDESAVEGGRETASWYLPTREVWIAIVTATCIPGGACDRVAVTFE